MARAAEAVLQAQVRRRASPLAAARAGRRVSPCNREGEDGTATHALVENRRNADRPRDGATLRSIADPVPPRRCDVHIHIHAAKVADQAPASGPPAAAEAVEPATVIPPPALPARPLEDWAGPIRRDLYPSGYVSGSAEAWRRLEEGFA